uniref:Uncharacterized protein n=1 Tax=Oryza punctata TaxID=4537 RepID=A0A0E0KKY5_ORYPU
MKGSDLPPGGSGQKPPSGPPGTRKGKRSADAYRVADADNREAEQAPRWCASGYPRGSRTSSTTAGRSNRLADAPPATPAAATAASTSPSSTTARRSNRLAGAPPDPPAAAIAAPTSPSPTNARRSNRLSGAPPDTPVEAEPSSTTARRSKRLAGAPPETPVEAGTSPSSTTARRSKRSAGKSPAIPEGSGQSSSAAKSKHTADASSANPAEARPSSLSPTTALVMTSAVSVSVRSAAARTRRTTTSGREDAADQEAMREAILYVRRERSVLAPDDLTSPHNEPRVAAAVALSWSRSAGAGELWNTPGRERAHVEPMRKAILDARRESSVLAADAPASPYNEPRVAAAATLSWVRSAGAGALWNTPEREDDAGGFVLAPAHDPASPYLEVQEVK